MSKPRQTDNAPRACTVTIDANQHGQRLDNFLMNRLKGVPRGHIYRLLRSGQVRVNSGRKKAHYRLKNGDQVRIPPVRTPSRSETTLPEDRLLQLDQRIVFDNEHLLVLDKPGGIPVHAGSGYRWGIIDLLRQRWPDQHFELVHRLDRETSGCLLVAKSRIALNACHTAFREQHDHVAKHYIALVQGHWHGSETIDIGIKKVVRSGERMMQASTSGARARSHFECRQIIDHGDVQASVMHIKIDTGRTHQIRVHAGHRQHPLAGDSKYGDKSFNATMRQYGLKRLFLHASSLQLQLPGIGRIQARAPLAEDLREVMERLEV